MYDNVFVLVLNNTGTNEVPCGLPLLTTQTTLPLSNPAPECVHSECLEKTRPHPVSLLRDHSSFVLNTEVANIAQSTNMP